MKLEDGGEEKKGGARESCKENVIFAVVSSISLTRL